MKYLTALSLAMAPLAMAKAVHNVYPVEARNGHLQRLGNDNKKNGNNNNGNGVIVEAQSTQIIIIWANPGNNAATTTIQQAVTVTQTVTAGAAAATTVGTTTIAAGATGTVAGTGATHSVQVGGAAGLVYTPASIQAAVGDMVIFTFGSQNHTVTQSSFATPCDPLANGMDSNFQPNPNNTVVPAPQVAMQVMTTDPIWFYCKQTGHCGKGMVFSINPTAEKTQDLFQAMAIQQKGQGTGSAITGNSTSSAVASDTAAATTVASATDAAGATQTASADGSLQTGSGQLVAGACVCAVTCGAGSFPAVDAQGIGNFGGVPGM
ncbi:Cupredoxin [Xylaria venustula]|nr:Cupredoxin [Xylaria venustula]